MNNYIKIDKLLNENELNEIIKLLLDTFHSEKKYPADKINIKLLRDNYDKYKKLDNWNDYYNKLSKISQNKSIKNKILTVSKIFISEPEIINSGIRIIEKNSNRYYPFHQEYVGIKKDFFIIFWIPLHDINKSYGGLSFFNDKKNIKRKHFINDRNYPILYNQNYYLKNSHEVSLKKGDCLIFNNLSVHASSIKTYGRSRWALIYRIGSKND